MQSQKGSMLSSKESINFLSNKNNSPDHAMNLSTSMIPRQKKKSTRRTGKQKTVNPWVSKITTNQDSKAHEFRYNIGMLSEHGSRLKDRNNTSFYIKEAEISSSENSVSNRDFKSKNGDESESEHKENVDFHQKSNNRITSDSYSDKKLKKPSSFYQSKLSRSNVFTPDLKSKSPNILTTTSPHKNLKCKCKGICPHLHRGNQSASRLSNRVLYKVSKQIMGSEIA